MDYLVSKQKVRYDGRCMHKPTSYFVIAGKSSSPHSVTPAELTQDVRQPRSVSRGHLTMENKYCIYTIYI